MTNFYKNALKLLSPVIWFFYRIKFIYQAEVPKDGGLIVASNHLSNLDPFFLAMAVPERMVQFMAKVELFKIPVIKFFVKKVGAFAIKRGERDTEGIQFAMDLIKDGKTMGIFPEGTRSKDGRPLRPKSGIALIAGTTKADILPVLIKPETKNGRVGMFKKTKVIIGKVIVFDELNIKENTPGEYKAASRLIMDRISSLAEETK